MKRENIMTIKVGFIGLGIMGKPMSKNLLKAGYSLVVSDRNPEAIADVIAAGAETATTPKAIAEQCDVIITMLPNSPHVKEVALGEDFPAFLTIPAYNRFLVESA